MFTGIIEEIGIIRKIQRGQVSGKLTIGAYKVLSDAKVGDSIAVNGICLTVTSLVPDGFTVDVMHETFEQCGFFPGGDKSESGEGHGCGRQIWRPYRSRSYR